MAKRRYILSYTSTKEVFPINDSEIIYQHNRKENTIYLSKELKTKLQFANNSKTGVYDFNFFYNFEKDVNLKCTDFYLLIQEKCGTQWIDEFTGEFTLNDADWDLDRCTLTVNIKEKNIYTCINKKKKEKYNFLSGTTKQTNQSLPAMNGYEFYVCTTATPFSACATLPGPNPSTWRYLHSDVEYYDIPTDLGGGCLFSTVNVTIMVRLTETTLSNNGALVPPIGSGWLLEENNSTINNTARWVKIAPWSYPTPTSNPGLLFGYYDDITLETGGFNKLWTKEIRVLTTPGSPPIIGFDRVHISGIPGTGSDWFYYVLNNPNSTYVWSYIPSAGTDAMNIVSGQGTNEIRVNFTGVQVGIGYVQLTETHGNGHVSTVQFNIVYVGTALVPAFWWHSYPTMNSYDQYRFYAPKPPVSTSGSVTVTLTGINSLGLYGNAGPQPIGPTTVNYLVKVNSSALGVLDLQCIFNATVTGTAVPDQFIGIDEQYQNELNIRYDITKAGYSYTHIWRSGKTIIPSFTSLEYIFFSKNSLGLFCLSLQYIEYTAPFFPAGAIPIINIPDYYLSVWVSPGTSIGTTIPAISYPNQVKLKDVFEKIVLNKLDCGVASIVSDFFEWNSIGDTPNYIPGKNYVYGGLNKLPLITIGSASDVINYSASNVATKCEITFQQLEEILIICFNAYWFIDNSNRFRIEHESWFHRLTLYNANDITNNDFNKAKNKYMYDKSKIPRKETFTFQKSITEDFIGLPIIYSGLCPNDDPDSNETEYTLNKVITDIIAIPKSPKEFDLRSFVLMCINPIYNTYIGNIVDFEVGLISNQTKNNGHLSWANLLYNYHRYNRPLPTGLMNGVLTNFITTKKSRQQKEITLKNCCGDDYDFILSLVKTELGYGEVVEYEENKKMGTIKLNLIQ